MPMHVHPRAPPCEVVRPLWRLVPVIVAMGRKFWDGASRLQGILTRLLAKMWYEEDEIGVQIETNTNVP